MSPRQLARRRAPVGPVEPDDDFEDEAPRASRRRSRDEDAPSREPIRRSRRSRDDDDDEDPPRRGRRSRDDEDEKPRRATAKANGGWVTVKSNRAARYSNPGRLQVKDKEVVVKFLEPEPFASYGQHWVGQRSYTCGLNADYEKCPLCNMGNPCRYLALFNVTDMDSAENRYWEVGPEATKTLMEFHEEERTSPLSRDGLYFAAKRFKKDNGFYGFKISSIKERDLDDEFGLEPLDEGELAEAEEKLFDASVIPTNTLAELKAAAAKEEEDD